MESEFDTASPEGSLTDTPASVSLQVADRESQANTLPPISGFRRRLAAFSIDVIVLGIVGQVLGWSLSSIWFRVGPYGRFVGLIVGLLYFGFMGSSFAGGQTLGKRLLGLAVRDRDGNSIPLRRSMLRTLVWIVPLTLNGLEIPLMENTIAASIASVVVLGVGGAIVVTMVFNRKRGQGLHDLLMDTFVLRLGGQPVESLPISSRFQWKLSAGIVAAALLLSGAGFLLTSRFETLQQMMELHRLLQSDNRFFSVVVNDGTFYSRGGQTRSLQIRVWCKGVPSDVARTSAMNSVAKIALAMPDVQRYDLISIDTMSAFDLGIASGHVSQHDGETVNTWRERLRAEKR